MNLVKGNINFSNELIDATPVGQTNDTLEDLIRTFT